MEFLRMETCEARLDGEWPLGFLRMGILEAELSGSWLLSLLPRGALVLRARAAALSDGLRLKRVRLKAFARRSRLTGLGGGWPLGFL